MRLKYQFDIARFDSPWRGRLKAGPRREGRPAGDLTPYHSVRAHATVVSRSSRLYGPCIRLCPTRVCELSTCPSVAYIAPFICKSRQDSGEEPWAGAGVRHGRRRPWFGPWRRQSSGELSFVFNSTRDNEAVLQVACFLGTSCWVFSCGCRSVGFFVSAFMFAVLFVSKDIVWCDALLLPTASGCYDNRSL